MDLEDISLSPDIGAHQHEDVQLLVTKQKRTFNRRHAVIESEDTRKNNESRKLCFSDCWLLYLEQKPAYVEQKPVLIVLYEKKKIQRRNPKKICAKMDSTVA